MGQRKTVVAVVATALALAAGATAIAAPGGGPFGLFEDREERRAENAQALGEKLGVNPARVDRALREVHEERREAREDEMVAALAKRLDVSAEDAERALERAFAAKQEERGEATPARGERPERGERRGGRLARAIAEELDKSPAEVRDALSAVRRERLDARLAEAVKDDRITEEQADDIRERFESRRGRGFGPPPFGGLGHGPHDPGDGPGGPEAHGGPEAPGGPPPERF